MTNQSAVRREEEEQTEHQSLKSFRFHSVYYFVMRVVVSSFSLPVLDVLYPRMPVGVFFSCFLTAGKSGRKWRCGGHFCFGLSVVWLYWSGRHDVGCEASPVPAIRGNTSGWGNRFPHNMENWEAQPGGSMNTGKQVWMVLFYWTTPCPIYSLRTKNRSFDV